MEWDEEGKGVNVTTVEEEKLCHYNRDYIASRVPSYWTWSAGNCECKKVGQMYDDFIGANKANKTFHSLGDYDYVWTSFEYIPENETIVNLNDNSVYSYKYG